MPAPTQLAPGVEEGADQGNARTAWIERMHRTASDDNWRLIERQNREATAKRFARQAHALSRSVSQDSIAPGVWGTWHERGSTTQAGSVLATAYQAATDQLYAISAGGSMWIGPSDGSNWQVLNQNHRFEQRCLALLPMPQGQTRILSAIDRQPAYSDDNGATWTISRDLSPAVDGWAYTRGPILVNTGSQTLIYALTKRGYWSDPQLIVSTDAGASWQVVQANGAFVDAEAHLTVDPAANLPLLWTSEGMLYTATPSGITLLHSSSLDLDDASLAAATDGSTLHLYTYDADDDVFHSADTGRTWTQRGALPGSPWSVGIYAHPQQPNKLLMGNVQAYSSTDGGANWTLINRWGEYYGDPVRYLHADMMTFATYVKTDGTEFTLSANHGGINATQDWFRNSVNITQHKMNVGQMYSVTSSPNFREMIFAGTQDQGLQRGEGDYTETIPMEQVISGDYGHLTFAADGLQLWAMYPGTGVSVYRNAMQRGYSDWLTLDSDDESVWLPPMCAHPDPARLGVIVAGGSTIDDGPGSFLIEMELSPNNVIIAEEQTFDFLDQSGGGVLSALGTSPLSSQRIYAATDNGRFFTSPDQGASWEQSVTFIPGGHYLYGQAIEASPVLDSTVWLAGSGYSGPGVWRSDDAGRTFTRDVTGLPSTMTFELATSPDGVWLYAATEAGPYVQRTTDRVWYPLATPEVPNQTFWTVDYVESDSIVRFATYGRGVWDFKLQAAPDTTLVSTKNAREVLAELRVFPNPASVQLNVRGLSADVREAQLLDGSGRVITTYTAEQLKQGLDVGSLPRGPYTLTVSTSSGTASRQIVLR